MVNPSSTAETPKNSASSAASTANTSSAAAGPGAGASAGAGNGRNGDAASIAEAIEQMKLAAASVYEAVGTLRTASGSAAKDKLDESKVKAKGYEAQAESAIAEKPLLYLGAAFAAGWLVSKLMKSS